MKTKIKFVLFLFFLSTPSCLEKKENQSNLLGLLFSCEEKKKDSNKKQLVDFTLFRDVKNTLITNQFCPVSEDKVSEIQRIIPETIKDLMYYEGKESARYVVINIQGGPSTDLDNDFFKKLIPKLKNKEVLKVNVHQKQTLKPDLFQKDITAEQATAFNNETIEMIDKVIQTFKNQNRKVYIVGASFGAFVTQELIRQKGIKIADKYIISVGRLDINEDVWRGFMQGKQFLFKDGITPYISDKLSKPTTVRKNMMKLAGNLGKKRYTKILDKYKDLSQITYIYGEKDIAVGRLLPHEIQFLESAKAKVIKDPRGHNMYPEYMVQEFKNTFGLE